MGTQGDADAGKNFQGGVVAALAGESLRHWSQTSTYQWAGKAWEHASYIQLHTFPSTPLLSDKQS